MSDNEEACPLCLDSMDVTDVALKSCKCGYHICLWCYHRIQAEPNPKCPACRVPYPKLENVKAPDEEIKKKAKEEQNRKKALKEQEQRDRKDRNRHANSNNGFYATHPGEKALQTVRVRQRNLVYVVGLPLSIAKEEILKKKEFFGRFGRIQKVAITRKTQASGVARPTATAYVTYKKETAALEAIKAMNGQMIDGKMLKATFGTTKYCSFFLRNQPCVNPNCLYLHELARQEDCYTKDDLASSERFGEDPFVDIRNDRNTAPSTPTTDSYYGSPPGFQGAPGFSSISETSPFGLQAFNPVISRPGGINSSPPPSSSPDSNSQQFYLPNRMSSSDVSSQRSTPDHSPTHLPMSNLNLGAASRPRQRSPTHFSLSAYESSSLASGATSGPISISGTSQHNQIESSILGVPPLAPQPPQGTRSALSGLSVLVDAKSNQNSQSKSRTPPLRSPTISQTKTHRHSDSKTSPTVRTPPGFANKSPKVSVQHTDARSLLHNIRSTPTSGTSTSGTSTSGTSTSGTSTSGSTTSISGTVPSSPPSSSSKRKDSKSFKHSKSRSNSSQGISETVSVRQKRKDTERKTDEYAKMNGFSTAPLSTSLDLDDDNSFPITTYDPPPDLDPPPPSSNWNFDKFFANLTEPPVDSFNLHLQFDSLPKAKESRYSFVDKNNSLPSTPPTESIDQKNFRALLPNVAVSFDDPSSSPSSSSSRHLAELSTDSLTLNMSSRTISVPHPQMSPTQTSPAPANNSRVYNSDSLQFSQPRQNVYTANTSSNHFSPSYGSSHDLHDLDRPAQPSQSQPQTPNQQHNRGYNLFGPAQASYKQRQVNNDSSDRQIHERSYDRYDSASSRMDTQFRNHPSSSPPLTSQSHLPQFDPAILTLKNNSASAIGAVSPSSRLDRYGQPSYRYQANSSIPQPVKSRPPPGLGVAAPSFESFSDFEGAQEQQQHGYINQHGQQFHEHEPPGSNSRSQQSQRGVESRHFDLDNNYTSQKHSLYNQTSPQPFVSRSRPQKSRYDFNY